MAEETAWNTPSPELAAQILRQVSWSERLEGYIYDAGPGMMPERVFKLEEVHNLLAALPDFSVDFRALERWVREVLGDAEAAERIAAAARDTSEDDARPTITRLLGERLEQCRAVLEGQDEGTAGA